VGLRKIEGLQVEMQSYRGAVEAIDGVNPMRHAGVSIAVMLEDVQRAISSRPQWARPSRRFATALALARVHALARMRVGLATTLALAGVHALAGMLLNGIGRIRGAAGRITRLVARGDAE